MSKPGFGTRKVFIETVREKNREIKIQSIVSTSETMKASVINSIAPSIISKPAIEKELRKDSIQRITITGISLKRPFYLVLKNFPSDLYACNEFIKLFNIRK